jgi:high-affinity nickel-transport protein
MISELLAVSAEPGLRLGLAVTAFGFGVRHGVDWDHIAALTDITGSQQTPRRSMLYASLYALGHGLVVFLLGLAAIVFAARLPTSIDGPMERLVGLTLLALGLYVFLSLARQGREFRMRSRWMLIFACLRRLYRRWRRPTMVVIEHDHLHPAGEPHPLDHAHDRQPALAAPAGPAAAAHGHGHRHLVAVPDDPFPAYGRATAFAVGMVHGVGAETPTQVLLFVTAAGAGGRTAGTVLLVCFLAGLLTSNTLVALAATFGFLRASANFGLYVAVSVLIGASSVVLGVLFLSGRGGSLPAILNR